MKHRYKMIMTVFGAAVLAIGLTGCGSSDDMDDDVTVPTVPTEPTGPTEMDMAVTAAMAAEEAAMTASDAAAAAATEAATDVANLATSQTGAAAGMLAYEADKYAGIAMAEYEKAKKAAADAAAAADITGAVEAKAMALDAQKAAKDASDMAVEKSTASKEAAMAELMISGKDKSVGGSKLNADDGALEVTTNDKTVATGRMKAMDAMGTVGTEPGVSGIPGNPNIDMDPYVAPMAGAEGRTFTIGKTIDSSDDMARLMLVTSYAGTKTVKVYAGTAGADVMSRKANTIQTDGFGTDDNADDDEFVGLKSVGTYYLAAGSDSNLQASPTGHVVGKKAKAEQVYSYVDDNKTPDTADDATVYVVLKGRDTKMDTWTYAVVGIHVVVDRDGDNSTNNDHEVTAKIPEATEYKHIHFGVWAGLNSPKDDGTQTIADLGIGFVQSIGDGMTGDDMPNNGGANYSGNWVAAVRASDDDGDGDITLTSGDATLAANFTKGEVSATLTGLATLEGDIDGAAFSGDKATVETGNLLGLDSDGDFTGEFSGGFYGAKAAEAGGIFDFTSEDMEEGEFRGAFGADRVPD